MKQIADPIIRTNRTLRSSRFIASSLHRFFEGVYAI
jgi:hypothetical protein